MSKTIHCPMIHGGLHINLKNSEDVQINHCCLRNDLSKISNLTDIWASPTLLPLRELNKQNKWDSGCWTCQGNERSNMQSFRTGMMEKFGIKTDLSGPQRLDLMFDISCNLACRSCGPGSSTYWQKHLRENNIPFRSPTETGRIDEMISILRSLDLSNLEMVVFCGGETLLGQGYWRVAEVLAELAPADQITLCFQTNGTQPIAKRNYDTIEKFQLVKLHISLDGCDSQFEYLRWPANWQQVVDNILDMRETLPANVMFLIEETMTIFNLFYQERLGSWVKQNFSTNRLGDIVDHTRHRARGVFSLDNLSQEYVNSLKGTALEHLISPTWSENSAIIQYMITEIDRFDKIRNQNWRETFPEVSEFYSRFL